MTGFLTFHGTLLCADRATGALVHRPAMALGDDVEPVKLSQPVEMFRTSFDHYVRHQPLFISISERSSRLGDVAIVASSDPRCVEMTRDGAHLRADFDGTIVSQSGADEQTRFLPISDAELDVLRFIASNDWVVRSSGKIVPRAAVSLGQWFGLRFDSLQVDLRYHLPLDLSQCRFGSRCFKMRGESSKSVFIGR